MYYAGTLRVGYSGHQYEMKHGNGELVAAPSGSGCASTYDKDPMLRSATVGHDMGPRISISFRRPLLFCYILFRRPLCA